MCIACRIPTSPKIFAWLKESSRLGCLVVLHIKVIAMKEFQGKLSPFCVFSSETYQLILQNGFFLKQLLHKINPTVMGFADFSSEQCQGTWIKGLLQHKSGFAYCMV